MSKPVSELFNTLGGRPAAVIGGGTATISDLELIPKGSYIIAVNHHCNDLLEPDLAVALDETTYDRMTYICPKVGAKPPYEYSVWDGNQCLLSRYINNSCFTAVDIALAMGAGEVWLVGIDCYIGGAYWYDDSVPLPRKSDTPQKQKMAIQRWGEYYQGKNVYACSGPLVEVLNGIH